MAKKVNLSLCMIAKNEEKLIGKCLESVKDIADEIILVDTGSTDGTVGIAKGYGAKIYTFEWDDSFSDARNFSIEKAKGKWILLMDADEEFEKSDRELFLEYIKTAKTHGCHFKMLNYSGKTAGSQYSVHNAFRLLRNNGLYRFEGRIHEQIKRKDGKPIPSGTFGLLPVRLHHYGYLDDVVKKQGKRERNLPLLLSELEKDPENPFLLFNLGNEYLASCDYSKAISVYDKGYRKADFTQAYAPHLVYRRAMTYRTLRMPDASVSAAAEGLTKYPQCTDLEFLRGSVYFEQGKYTLAVDSFQRCIEMGDPPPTLKFVDGCGTFRPLMSLGHLYETLCDYGKALDCYSKAIAKDKSLYQNLYYIGGVLNKLFIDKEMVAKKLLGYFVSPEYLPNRIVLTDILIRQRLYSDAFMYLDQMDAQNEYPGDRAFLRGKLCFYTREFQKARELFRFVLNAEQTAAGILQNIRGESAEYLFVLHLIDPEAADSPLESINEFAGQNRQALYRVISSVLQGEGESYFGGGEDWGELIGEFSKVLDKILKVQEFDLFEKLLYVFNYIDSKAVLISLASLYHENGYDDLAVKTVLRSVKELDYIDQAGVDLLARAYKK